MRRMRFWSFAMGGLLAAMLTACGGGGGSSSNPSTVTVISGTAATGAPIVGRVVAIDSSNPAKAFAATTSVAGAYTVNVAGGTAPFILTVVGTSGGRTVSLNSVATAVGQTVNITPLTDLIVSTAAAQPGGTTLANLCTPTVQPGCTAALTAATSGTKLSTAVTAVSNMVAFLNTSGTDPLNGTFTANGTGMDGVLDQILVTPAPAQGGMATITLIAVPTQQLGTVAITGGTATTTTVTPSPTTLTAAATAATALSEIQACLASFNALYSTTTMPTSQQVAPFIDTSFSMGSGVNQQAAITMLSTPATITAGNNAGFAQQGFTLTASALSDFDFSQQTATAGVTTAKSSPALNLTAATPYAWVKMNMATSNGGPGNWKMVKGAAYTGCSGGWKVAGVPHVQMHMNAVVAKNTFGAPATTTYTRRLAFHVETNNAVAENIGSIVVTGPGLSVYSGNAATPVGTATPITLVTPPVPTPPAVRLSAMSIQGFSFPSDSIQSCQDLAATTATAGTPCYDETAVAPGAVFTWTLYNGTNPATATVLYAFPFQIHAVPLSIAFVQANDQYLYAQNISASPQGTANLNTAVANIPLTTPLDGAITLNYTVSSVYGAQTNHCGIGVTDANNTLILRAEQNADGLPTQQTSCTINTDGLNSGSLSQPVDINGLRVPFGGTNSYMYVTNMALGNMLVSSLPY